MVVPLRNNTLRNVPRRKFLILRWRCALYIHIYIYISHGYCDERIRMSHYEFTRSANFMIIKAWLSLPVSAIELSANDICIDRFPTLISLNSIASLRHTNSYDTNYFTYERKMTSNVTLMRFFFTRDSRAVVLARHSHRQRCWNYFYHKITHRNEQRL